MIELLEFTTLLISIHNTKLAEATASLHALHHASVQTKEGISPSALQCKQQALFDNWHTIDMCSHCWSIVVSSSLSKSVRLRRARRKDARSAQIKRSNEVTKYLCTRCVFGQEKAGKLKQSLPPSESLYWVWPLQ
ncbi:PREDICTED: uncharacterized protein LOC109116538 [Tarenaya hassleriana]|uniref:uncharacterized protein LOC109116538 n=1 Tax=Tarenaya hassleriana TaxID=28532 RepID=UPI0008FCE51E|nr:PREDICTED: uncharacterized protein LOC109116538 [Tarenaya hassleriana]